MEVSTDLLFTCAARRTASAVADAGTPVYRYLFTRPPLMFSSMKCMGAPHASELNLLFAKAFPKQAIRFVVGDKEEQKLAAAMVDRWGDFATKGLPGSAWPAWSTSETLLQLGSANTGNLTQVRGYRVEQCKLLDNLVQPRYSMRTSVLI